MIGGRANQKVEHPRESNFCLIAPARKVNAKENTDVSIATYSQYEGFTINRILLFRNSKIYNMSQSIQSENRVTGHE